MKDLKLFRDFTKQPEEMLNRVLEIWGKGLDKVLDVIFGNQQRSKYEAVKNEENWFLTEAVRKVKKHRRELRLNF